MANHSTAPLSRLKRRQLAEAKLAAERKRAIAEGTERRVKREARSAAIRVQALALRQSGATYAAIGKALDLSLERARFFAIMAERLINNPRWYDGLPKRAQHFLQLNSLAELPEAKAAAAVAKLSRRELLSHPNIGKGAVAALADWLTRHGYTLKNERPASAQLTGRQFVSDHPAGKRMDPTQQEELRWTPRV